MRRAARYEIQPTRAGIVQPPVRKIQGGISLLREQTYAALLFTTAKTKSLVLARTGNSLAQFKGDLTLEFPLA
jgi:hypothetical protein